MPNATGPLDPGNLAAERPQSLALLIVDDEAQMVVELAEAAADAGFACYTASTGDAALALLQAHGDIAVAISDIRMPGLDGLALTREAFAVRHEAEALEVILITGHATLEDAIGAIRSGAFDFVRKPFRLREVFEAVHRAMAKAMGRRALASRPVRGAILPSVVRTDSAAQANRQGALRGLMHELRSPMVPVLGYAELLEQVGPSPETMSYGREIRMGAQRLLSTVDNLLTLTMLEDGMMAFARQEVALEPYLQAVLLPHECAAAVKGVSLKLGPRCPASIAADPALLHQALDILLRIAIERTPRDGTIMLSAEAGGTGSLLIMDAAAPPGSAADTPGDVWAALDQIAPLGLRLAERVLGQHGGNLTLSWEDGVPLRAVLGLGPVGAD